MRQKNYPVYKSKTWAPDPDLEQTTWLGWVEIPIWCKETMCTNHTTQWPHIHSNSQEKAILANNSCRHKEPDIWLLSDYFSINHKLFYHLHGNTWVHTFLIKQYLLNITDSCWLWILVYLKAQDTTDSHCSVLWMKKERKTRWASVKSQVQGRHSYHPVNMSGWSCLFYRENWGYDRISHVPRVTHLKKRGWDSNTSMSNSKVPMCEFRTNLWCQNTFFLFIYFT